MLRPALTLLLSLVQMTAGFAQTPPAANPNPNRTATYRVAYVEVAPSEVGRVTALLREYRQATLKAVGIVRVLVLQQVDRANHFAIQETWKDFASLDAHQSAAEAPTFRDELQRARISPMDERLLQTVSSATLVANPSDAALFVLTHADARGDREQAGALMKSLAEQSRQQNGNVVFDVTNQPTATNHFTIVEAWRDQRAFEAHQLAEQTRRFRDGFGVLSGALYDERLYRSIK